MWITNKTCSGHRKSSVFFINNPEHNPRMFEIIIEDQTALFQKNTLVYNIASSKRLIDALYNRKKLK